MTANSYHWYQRYEPLRRRVEVGFWLVLFGLNAGFNSITQIMALRRRELDFHSWEPVVWEISSGLAFLLLVPTVVWFTRHFAFEWRAWRRWLWIYLAASVAFSLAHVLGMVTMRHGAYAIAGHSYSFGPWLPELLYEYLKDFRTFLGMVFIIAFYRFALRRMRGEARLLDDPDDEPAEPRPDRFLVKMLGREFLVSADRIESAKAAGNYVNLHVGEREYPLRITLTRLLDQLDPERFMQVHRSWLVNLDQVAAIEPLDSGDARIQLASGRTVPCSRRYRDALRSRLA